MGIKVNDSDMVILESHIWPIPECGCWLLDEDESALTGCDCLTAKVDEIMYSTYRGNIPEQFELCHTCHTNNCVNPNHMCIKPKM